jgi:hypothetical protein
VEAGRHLAGLAFYDRLRKGQGRHPCPEITVAPDRVGHSTRKWEVCPWLQVPGWEDREMQSAQDQADDKASAASQSPDTFPGEETTAVFANRFYVIGNPTFTRISFAEQVMPRGREYQRIAIILSTTDARQLADVLMNVARSLESQGSTRDGEPRSPAT